jgi:YD repeat-containing protein
VTQTNFPSSLSENYKYDANNNLTGKTDRKGQTITYLYDSLNQLTSKTYPDTTAVDCVYDLVEPYDAFCRLFTLAFATGSFPDGERKSTSIGIDCLMCRHAKFRPLASHGTPCRHSKIPRRCDTRKQCRSGDHKRGRRRVF